MKTRHLAFITCWLLFISTNVPADDFPAPPHAHVQSVANSVSSLGMDMNIRKFQTKDSMEEVLQFYRDLWQDQAAEVEMPPWTMIGTRVGGEYFNVQMQNVGGHTWGYLSISDLPEKIDNRTLKLPQGEKFPKMSGSRVLDDQLSNDPGKKGRTLLITNSFSVKSNHDYYRNYYKNKGWKIVMDELTAPRNGAYAMYMTKGSESVTLTINKVDGKTSVVANHVKRGLLR